VATSNVFYLKGYNHAFWYTTFLVRLSLEMMLMMRHLGDDVYMTSQPRSHGALLQLKKCGCKILQKWFFSNGRPISDIWFSPCVGHVRHGSACKISPPYVRPFGSQLRWQLSIII